MNFILKSIEKKMQKVYFMTEWYLTSVIPGDICSRPLNMYMANKTIVWVQFIFLSAKCVSIKEEKIIFQLNEFVKNFGIRRQIERNFYNWVQI